MEKRCGDQVFRRTRGPCACGRPRARAHACVLLSSCRRRRSGTRCCFRTATGSSASSSRCCGCRFGCSTARARSTRSCYTPPAERGYSSIMMSSSRRLRGYTPPSAGRRARLTERREWRGVRCLVGAQSNNNTFVCVRWRACECCGVPRVSSAECVVSFVSWASGMCGGSLMDVACG